MRNLKISLFFVLLFSTGTYAQKKVWNLRECIDRAWQENIQLKLTISNNSLNSINEYQSKAALYPNLNGSASQGFNFGRSLDPSTYQYVNESVRSNNFGLNSNVVLFNGFQYRNTIKKYGLDVDAGKQQIEKTKNDIALNVAGAYLQILLAQEQLAVAQSQVAAAQINVDKTKIMVDVGKLAEANLYQLKSQLAGYKSQEITAENQIALAKLTLEQLMELPASDDFTIEIPVLNGIPLIDTSSTTDQIYKVALGNQPQIKGADLQVQSAAMSYNISKGAYLPKLTLGGSLTSSYSSARNLISYEPVITPRDIAFLKSNPTEIVTVNTSTLTPISSPYSFTRQVGDNFGQALLFSLSVPIFTNLQTKAGVDRAKVNIEQVQLNQKSTMNDLRKSVEQAYTDLKAAGKKYIATQEQVDYSQISYNNILARFNQGFSTANDLFIENSNYIQAKSALIQAKYDFIFKQKVLDFYLGKPISL